MIQKANDNELYIYIYNSCRIKGTNFRVIVENDEQVEISFTRTWDSSMEGKVVPLNIDKRYFNFTLRLITTYRIVINFERHVTNYLDSL